MKRIAAIGVILMATVPFLSCDLDWTQSVWTRQMNGLDYGLNGVRAVDFVNPVEGWALGMHPTQGFFMLHTMDGGGSWERQNWDMISFLALDLAFANRFVGWTAGMNLVRFLESDFVNQVSYTFIPLVVLADGGGIDWMQSFSHIVLVAGTLAGLIYFYFSKPHTGVLKPISRIGVYFIMICFGASFGYTVMARISLLIGRLTFLVEGWIKPMFSLVSGSS